MGLTTDVVAKIKHIELASRRLLHAQLLGHSRSLSKGSGIEFDQLRDYAIGDDVRSIDWKSSARMSRMLVKQFNDEKTRTLIIAIDNSASTWFGSDSALKHERLSEIAAMLALVGGHNKDAVGLLIYSDIINEYIPPKKGAAHMHLILQKLFTKKNSVAQTNTNCALEHILKLRKKNLMIFLLSDFIDEGFERNLASLASRSEVVAMRMIDPHEHALPIKALLTLRDSENEQEQVITFNKTSSQLLANRSTAQRDMFRKLRIDLLDIQTSQELVDQLIHFFRFRHR